MTGLRAWLWCAALGCLLGACGDTAPPDTGDPPDAGPPVGRLSLAWEIVDGDQPLSCAAIDAEVVRVQVVPSGGGGGLVETIACEEGVGAMSMPEDVYDVQVTLISPLGQLGEAFTWQQVEVLIGQTESLGRISFDVPPRGDVTFLLDAGAEGGNCEPAPGGGDIVEMRLEMRKLGGACVPTTFEIGEGATRPAGTYESDCAGAAFACIERDQSVRAVGVPSGTNVLTVVGITSNGQACYRRISQFDVPGGDLTASLPVQRLVEVVDEPACGFGAELDGGPVDAAPVDAGP